MTGGVTITFKDGTKRTFTFDSVYETNKLTMGQKALSYEGGFVIVHHGELKTAFPSETVAEVSDTTAYIIQKYRGKS